MCLPPSSRSGLPPETRHSDALDAVRTAIDEQPAALHTLAALSSRCGMSRWQFARAFRCHTGWSPHAYVVQKRLELARRLIGEGRPLSAAAMHSGFSDQSHMTRAFRDRYGITPRTWALAAAPGSRTGG